MKQRSGPVTWEGGLVLGRPWQVVPCYSKLHTPELNTFDFFHRHILFSKRLIICDHVRPKDEVTRTPEGT